MANITRWDPFTEMQMTMDRFFETAMPRPWRLLRPFPDTPDMPVEVAETDGNVEIKASLPGVKPDDIQVTVQGDMVQIRAESREEEEEKKKNYYRREIEYGAVQRSIPLPTPVDADQASANFENGVLRLTLPKSREAMPKQIKIGGQQALSEGQRAA